MNPLRSLLALCATIALLTIVGCNRPQSDPATERSTEIQVAKGVIVRSIPIDGLAGESAAALIDIDLSTANIRTQVVAQNVKVEKGRVFADARTVKDWCQAKNALAGINGGFFGVTRQDRKEVIGLLAREETIVSSGKVVRSPRNPNRRFVRCVLGFDKEGAPHIGWAVGQRGRAAMLTEYLEPLNPVRQRFWTVDSAVACGPRLIWNGRIAVTDKEERLVSPPPFRRTFAAYSLQSGKPRHLVLGIAESMTFQDVGAFLERYFRRYHNTPCAEAMCLDGGASSQLSYRTQQGLTDIRPVNITVPTAILILTN